MDTSFVGTEDFLTKSRKRSRRHRKKLKRKDDPMLNGENPSCWKANVAAESSDDEDNCSTTERTDPGMNLFTRTVLPSTVTLV